MKSEKVSFFLPTRRGSERVANKNTKPFAGIEGGLVENKIRQVIKTRLIDEIIFSSNDEACIDIASKFKDSRLKLIERPQELCLSSTNLQDLITYVPTITDAKHILWGHVTTPFCDSEEYDCAIKLYLEKIKEGHDSLVGVSEMKNFILNKNGKIINNSTNIPWPRTQDLDALYPINHTIFLAKRDVYTTLKNRIGNKPVLHIMKEIPSFDIDWPEDFIIAESIYLYLHGKINDKR